MSARLVLLLASLVGALAPLQAQDADSALVAAINRYLDDQADAILRGVERALAAHPPDTSNPDVRKMALYALDGIFHEERAPRRAAVQAFFRRRLTSVAERLDTPVPDDHARLWKWYNHGFIVQTARATLCFDLTDGRSVGAEGFRLDESTMGRLAVACDALFISHVHGDHADPALALRFLEAGKPVIMPEVGESNPYRSRLTVLERRISPPHAVPIREGRDTLQVVVFPGHQGSDLDNNVALVTTPEGMTFVQTGDQSNVADFAWIDGIWQRYQVDVLMPNCWTTDLSRLVSGIRPSLVVTGHENELGHTIDHREPYWQTFERKRGSARWGGTAGVGYEAPLAVMTWGEFLLYRPSESP